MGFSQSSGPGACPSLGALPGGSGAGRAGHAPAPSPGIPNSKLWAGGSRDWETKRKEDRGSGRGENEEGQEEMGFGAEREGKWRRQRKKN